MKSVLISISPEWCEKIVNGKVTIEVRKSAPKEFPFKAYIYCTRITDKKHCRDEFDIGVWKGNEHVIGEFICDYIYEWEKKDRLELIGICPTVRASYMIFVDDLEKTCLTYDELDEYGKNKTLYGWHISDLKIYDKPKELNRFVLKKPKNSCDGCGIANHFFDGNGDCNLSECDGYHIRRPPQSYMFVEEVKV